MLGFHFSQARDLYGLPERKVKSRLQMTSDGWPYRVYALDSLPGEPVDMKPLYAGIPYLTGHSPKVDQSLVIITGAETWVDLADHPLGGKRANFILESGLLEFFIFASLTPKANMKKLATITGFP